MSASLKQGESYNLTTGQVEAPTYEFTRDHFLASASMGADNTREAVRYGLALNDPQSLAFAFANYADPEY